MTFLLYTILGTICGILLSGILLRLLFELIFIIVYEFSSKSLRKKMDEFIIMKIISDSEIMGFDDDYDLKS